MKEIKIELNSFRWKMQTIKEKQEKLVEMRTDILSINSQQMSNEIKAEVIEKDKIATKMAIIIDYENIIAKDMEEAFELMKKTEDRFKRLPAREERIMVARYIRGKTWQEIAADVGYSTQHIIRIHGQALMLIKDECK